MNQGGLTESVLADPLTNQVAQFILGNETNDEVISAFIEKYGPTSFRELRRAVLKTLAPNAQTEGMIKGSLAGGMKDDIFGVIGDPEKRPYALPQKKRPYVSSYHYYHVIYGGNNRGSVWVSQVRPSLHAWDRPNQRARVNS